MFTGSVTYTRARNKASLPIRPRANIAVSPAILHTYARATGAADYLRLSCSPLPRNRNIRHSRNIPSIVCCTCCDCCGFFRSRRKVAFPSLLKVAPCHLLISLLCDFVCQRRSVLAIALICDQRPSHFSSDVVRRCPTRAHACMRQGTACFNASRETEPQ
jgi:hypothetical protein